MSRSDHEIVGIVIRDLDRGVTITNDAEAVCMELGDRGRIFYFDTDNILTELVHDHGRFKSFDLSCHGG